MARIYKLSGYIIDPDDFYDAGKIERYIKAAVDGAIYQHFHVEEADMGKWDDESPLNYDNCDLAECEKYFLRKYPQARKGEEIIVGAMYRHFKGEIVEVLGIAQDSEAPGQFYVVYRCSDGGIWARPYGMFTSDVDRKKYPDVKQKKRFERLEGRSCG